MTFNASTGYILTSTIQVNNRRIENVYTNNNDRINARQSVLTHELGHLFWLEDNPPVANSNQSIMHGSRNRANITVAQPYDHGNVRFIYD